VTEPVLIRSGANGQEALPVWHGIDPDEVGRQLRELSRCANAEQFARLKIDTRQRAEIAAEEHEAGRHASTTIVRRRCSRSARGGPALETTARRLRTGRSSLT